MDAHGRESTTTSISDSGQERVPKILRSSQGVGRDDVANNQQTGSLSQINQPILARRTKQPLELASISQIKLLENRSFNHLFHGDVTDRFEPRFGIRSRRILSSAIALVYPYLHDSLCR
jgi:hypothetical protein